MPGRNANPGEYRYGFNGKELDDDGTGMGGGGNTYDYGFRIYNPQIAKFLSVDPLTKNYPWYTPYQFAGDNPIRFIDLDGLEPAENAPNYGHNHILTFEKAADIINQPSNVNWHGHGITNLETANFFITLYKNRGRTIKNVVIFAHGTQNGISLAGENISEPLSSMGYQQPSTIWASSVSTYLEYLDLIKTDEEEAKKFRDGKVTDADMAAQFSALDALYSIANQIEDGGSLVLAACFAGNDVSGEESLGSLISKLNPNINVYLSKDGVYAGENTLDNPLITSSNYENGWVRYQDGEVKPLQSGSDFNLRLNSSGKAKSFVKFKHESGHGNNENIEQSDTINN